MLQESTILGTCQNVPISSGGVNAAVDALTAHWEQFSTHTVPRRPFLSRHVPAGRTRARARRQFSA
eukprot:5429852-Prymnesium_polylepis.1